MPEGYKLEKPVEETVLYEKLNDKVAAITLNRPEKHNCLYAPDQFLEIKRKVEMAAQDDSVKVVILRGNGPSFCSGDDLDRPPYETYGGRPGYRPPQRARLLTARTMIAEVWRSLIYSPKTIIAQAQGWVIGAGVTMTVCADLCIASDDAKFSQRHERIGFAGFSPGWQLLLLMTIGPHRMREWQLTGRTLTIEEAKEWGLVNKFVPRADLEAETLKWANAVALNSADGLMIAKTHVQLCYDLLGIPGGFTAGQMGHALFTNLKWDEDEFNFLRRRDQVGTREAFKERERRWEELGF